MNAERHPLLRHLRPALPPPPWPRQRPQVSFIVCTRDRLAVLEACIDSIRAASPGRGSEIAVRAMSELAAVARADDEGALWPLPGPRRRGQGGAQVPQQRMALGVH
ncbi:hypothetical protein EOA23_30405, partial [Mesorhizobium sp. M2A.F.Ca.ET.042.01.1.1]